MFRIAVVEDDPGYRSKLKGYIADFEQECGEAFQMTAFSDGLDIAENYTAAYDIILMDIEMKHLDGMAAAKRIRTMDKNVTIIFITNSAQFALQGYEVEALSYILKPISYFAFSQEMKKAVKRVKERSSFFLHVAQKDGMVRLDVSKLCYVESVGHNVVYHMETGEVVNRETLKSVEQKLVGQNFSRCNNGSLVNLAFVEKVDRDQVIVAGQALQISRPRRKAFMEDLAAYVGGK